MKFEEFIIAIRLTLQAYQSDPKREMTPRLQTIFKGVYKIIDDEDIIAAFRILYKDHVFIREASVMMFTVGSRLLKAGCF